jgi:hypothetical protein
MSHKFQWEGDTFAIADPTKTTLPVLIGAFNKQFYVLIDPLDPELSLTYVSLNNLIKSEKDDEWYDYFLNNKSQSFSNALFKFVGKQKVQNPFWANFVTYTYPDLSTIDIVLNNLKMRGYDIDSLFTYPPPKGIKDGGRRNKNKSKKNRRSKKNKKISKRYRKKSKSKRYKK